MLIDGVPARSPTRLRTKRTAQPSQHKHGNTYRHARTRNRPAPLRPSHELSHPRCVAHAPAPHSSQAAEKYLNIGADGGDVVAQRNLGLLYLEQGRMGEGAERLQAAAQAGDQQAADTLQRLGDEAQQKAKAARAQLMFMASNGDQRAAAMLRELSAATPA